MTKSISAKIKQYYRCYLCHQYLTYKHFYKSTLLTRNYKCHKCHQKKTYYYKCHSAFAAIKDKAYQFEYHRKHKISSSLIKSILAKFKWKSIVSGKTIDLAVCCVYKNTNLSIHNSVVLTNSEYKQYIKITDQNQALAFLPVTFVQAITSQ